MTIYIRNEKGGVQSVSEEHYNKYLTVRTNDGGTFPVPGVTILTEDEARAAHPQLFGAADPTILFTDDELARQLNRKKQLRELFAEDAAVTAARDAAAAAADPTEPAAPANTPKPKG